MKHARLTILYVATKLFAKHGYAGCSIRQICEAASVTKPVLYYHFHSKEHLYQELMLEMFNQRRKDLLRLSSFHGAMRERMISYVHSQFINCKKDPDLTLLLFRMMFAPEGEYPFFNFVHEFKRERKVIAGRLREQFNREKQLDPELVSTALMGVMLIEILEYLFTRRRTLTRNMAEKLVDLVLPPASTKHSLPIGKANRGRL
jgi:AcrR family transcriptional regulator